MGHSPAPVSALCQMKYVKYSQLAKYFIRHVRLPLEFRLWFTARLRSFSRSHCASSGSCLLSAPSSKLVTADVESDTRPLSHFTPARLKELMPPVTSLDLNAESFFCSRAPSRAVKSSSLLVLPGRCLSLFHLDGIKAVMNKLRPLWRNEMIWRWRLVCWPPCDQPKVTFITPGFFFLSFHFFSPLLRCTYNSIDLFCCKSLEISCYWFHFSVENFFFFFFDPFLFRTGTFSKRGEKKFLRLEFMYTWWWRWQQCCLGKKNETADKHDANNCWLTIFTTIKRRWLRVAICAAKPLLRRLKPIWTQATCTVVGLTF